MKTQRYQVRPPAWASGLSQIKRHFHKIDSNKLATAIFQGFQKIFHSQIAILQVNRLQQNNVKHHERDTALGYAA